MHESTCVASMAVVGPSETTYDYLEIDISFHSLSDCSPYGEPGGAASARPQKSDRRNMLVADKAIPRNRDIDNSELYDPYKKRIVATIAARPLRIGVVHANLRHAT